MEEGSVAEACRSAEALGQLLMHCEAAAQNPNFGKSAWRRSGTPSAPHLKTEERASRFEQLAVQQQQQLLGLQTQLARAHRRLLALSGRDGGRALLLAEHEAQLAHGKLKARDDEIAHLHQSLSKL
eukprot:4595046-Pleurochrysis_carterae.AAC.1